MVEEQATLAELQKIADEVSEAFHRPQWKVVARKWGDGVMTFSAFRRIYVPRAWLLKPDLAQFRFRVVLQRLYHEYHSRSLLYRIMVCLSIAIPLTFLVGLAMPHFLGLDLGVFIPIAVVVFIVIADLWLPYYDRKLRNSEAFLTRVLELSKDPEALRAHLLQEKASPETLAKFDATVRGIDQLAHG